MPQARDAPTKTFRTRKLLSAERQPSDSLGCQDGPRAKTPGNLSGREPRQVASRTRPVAGQGNQLMRILPYESAAVKVRVQGRVAKSGHFYAIEPANSVMAASALLVHGRPALRLPAQRLVGCPLLGGGTCTAATFRQSLPKVPKPNNRYRCLSACLRRPSSLVRPGSRTIEELSCHVLFAQFWECLAAYCWR
jgi:hypothetical protein